jgi:hypothetical protein
MGIGVMDSLGVLSGEQIATPMAGGDMHKYLVARSCTHIPTCTSVTNIYSDNDVFGGRASLRSIPINRHSQNEG